MQSGDWAYSAEHQELCQIIDVQQLWDQVICKIWLPSQNRVERIHAQEREKGEYAFLKRRQAVERIGLSPVRTHRATQLLQEEQSWREQVANKARVVPEINPLMIIRIEGERVHNHDI